MKCSTVAENFQELLLHMSRLVFLAMGTCGLQAANPTLTLQPNGNEGFDVYADGVLVAPIRLAANGAIVADRVEASALNVRLSGLRAKDSLAVTFALDDFVSITLASPDAAAPEPVVEFKLTLQTFNTNRWLAFFPGAPAPFHFLLCSMPTAKVWHQLGWLNATPFADPFPLLQDVHVNSPELSCAWNRNWGYICPLGGHPIPMIGLWDPAARLYVGYDFQATRVTDQSERYLATAYCWQQDTSSNFFTLAYPYGGTRYGQQVYPKGGEVLASRFQLEIDTQLPDTEDPNERFQARLFERYTNSLPPVPAMNDLAWIPGYAHLSDFPSAPGLTLYGSNASSVFRPPETVVPTGWKGHQEMPVDTAVNRGNTNAVRNARLQIESLLTNYAKVFTAGGETCLFWTKPLAGAWRTEWGGTNVTTLHESEGWFAGRVLVELYRYDVKHGTTNNTYLLAIDRLFNWAKHFVWSRNEFDDVPSSPFAIGSTLCSAFLLDYYFTFKDDAQRAARAALALKLAGNVTWRYLQVWAMDSDRDDGGVDGAFLAEPNSGRDWAALACANEVNWNIDGLTQVYVHTGDPRMRYYVRGMLQRWPALYRTIYESSIAQYGSDALTEGYGLFDGSGPGRGGRYDYGFTESLPFNEPIGSSTMRVIAGARACIAFDKSGTVKDVTDYRTDGNGSCSFRVVAGVPWQFDVTFSYPFVDISKFTVARLRNGVSHTLTGSEVTRPSRSPSSLYLPLLQNGDVITVGSVSTSLPVIPCVTPLEYREEAVQSTTNGLFVTVPVGGPYLLPQDWSNPSSFAGIIPGERWVYGIPYLQGLHAAKNQTAAAAPGARVVLVAFSPPENETLTAAPRLVLDDASVLPLSGNPALAWRGWPMLFDRMVLLDYAVIPSGRSLKEVVPGSTLLMGFTGFTGDAAAWAPFQQRLSIAAAEFREQELQRERLVALQKSYAELPAGKIALLPLDTGGAGANFAAFTGLRNKWVAITEAQLVDTNSFNPARYPVAFYLGSENYVKTVNVTGDGKTAVTRYLAGGGTLVVLATGPFPFYYGYGPNDQPGPSDPLLPGLGLPIYNAFEQAPANLTVKVSTNQSILTSVPAAFPFPPGDPRLRSVDRTKVAAANRYVPWLTVVDAQGRGYGDAACFIEFGTGAAKGGKIVYIWSTLVSGPQGQALMADGVTWILNAVFRPPPLKFNSISQLSSNLVALRFDGLPNLAYSLEARSDLALSPWLLLKDFGSSAVERSLAFTSSVAGTSARFFRCHERP